MCIQNHENQNHKHVECFAIEKDLSTMNIAETAQATITDIML